MKERPILFSAPMVRAILSGAKTQTRRIVKPQPEYGADLCHWSGTGWAPNAAPHNERGDMGCTCKPLRSPYGHPGDRLWVREAFTPFGGGAWYRADFVQRYGAWERDEPGGGVLRMEDRWTPSIHMKRADARLLLDVTKVRVERLQAITEEDARAEGVTPCDRCGGAGIDPVRVGHDPEWCAECGGAAGGIRHRDAFADLWDEINGERASWDSNPWVWVVTFKRAESAAVAA